jgi:hypothetical protein
MGESIYVDQDEPGQKDIYERTLAYVLCAPDGLNVNEETVRQGYVIVYRKARSSQLVAFHNHEARAKRANKGVWSIAADATAAPTVPTVQTPTQRRGVPPAVAPEVPPPPRESTTVTVYATRTGKNHHAAGCGYLRSSRIPMPVTAAGARGPTPCSVCNPPR